MQQEPSRTKLHVMWRLWEVIESGGKYYNRIREGNGLHKIHFATFNLTAHWKAHKFRQQQCQGIQPQAAKTHCPCCNRTYLALKTSTKAWTRGIKSWLWLNQMYRASKQRPIQKFSIFYISTLCNILQIACSKHLSLQICYFWQNTLLLAWACILLSNLSLNWSMEYTLLLFRPYLE